jgi:phosphoribosylformylglycinamidine cyclo-ligase
MDYRQAGVDIDRATSLIARIRDAAETTRRPGWLDGIGGFGALFRLDLQRWRRPVLVSSTDGVGTKLKIAQAMGKHDTIGIDLVAMCANDILVQGAVPLFFLDYLAVGRLETEVAADLIRGIAEGCRRAECCLVGGETAEMPGMYGPGDYDLAGFVVGVVEEDSVVDGRAILPGDRIVGLPSTGVHSNGFSLVRAILGGDLGETLGRRIPDREGSLGEILLEPTAIYVKAILPLLATGAVKGMAHITGGGLPDNVARILPGSCRAVFDPAAWPRPPVFDWIRREGEVPTEEMYRVFNMGLGFVLVVDAGRETEVMEILAEGGSPAHLVGEITEGVGDVLVRDQGEDTA